jgi:Holliday junction resolvase
VSARSHRKGRRGEQEIATAYRLAGFPAARVPNSGGLATKGDVTGVPAVHVEVKRTERLRIYEALDQAEAEAPAGHTPALHFRRSGSGWYVAVPLDDWIDRLREGGQ